MTTTIEVFRNDWERLNSRRKLKQGMKDIVFDLLNTIEKLEQKKGK